MEDIIKKNKLFWQYPVITEKTFYEQNKDNENFIGIPWATILDIGCDINKIIKEIKEKIDTTKTYYTCCQHIYFKKLINIWKFLNIKTVYIPHKVKNENIVNDITFKPCPLYAVNIEDDKKNTEFKNKDILNTKRNILYNFAGGYQENYLTDIRKKIFEMKHPDSTYIKNTGEWHFNKLVYGGKQNIKGDLLVDTDHIKKTQSYNTLLLISRYTLAPSGSGPNSIRFWEALGAGSIPVLLADTLELPEHKLWEKAIVRVNEKDVERLPEILEGIDDVEENERRENCLKIYEHFKDNYKNESKNENIIKANNIEREIIHYCCGTYYRGAVGGVARYDYQISLAFPKYKHFTGPQEKGQLLSFLETCKNPLVITDNHLACDIPNKYEVILVHHGCAMTTATRNPDWGEPWKSLCTNGQNKMLTYRDPNKTTIVSISQACTDDFIKYYGNTYLKFNRIPLLHPSELNETKYKIRWNAQPIILGNWRGIKKGERLLPILKKNIPNFKFQQLNISIDSRGFENFNERKQNIYLNSDIFLQISNSEGNSYATLDALICGLPVVSSNVGLFYKDVPEDCYVKLEWERNGDAKYVEDKLKYAWEHRIELGKKAREWYMKNCRFIDWQKTMRDIVYKV